MLRLWDSGATNSLPPATSLTGHMAKLAHQKLPPLELLQELFEICTNSPSGLRWRIARTNHVKPGQIAGAQRSDGYWVVSIKTDVEKCYRTHRIVYFLKTGEDPGTAQVDHIFGIHDQLNLRLATYSENTANSKQTEFYAGQRCSSKFKGVYWSKKAQKWQAYINYQRKRTHLGLFIDEREAASAYNKAAVEYFGEFAKINEIEQ
jgi:hypothetical protein